MSKSRKSKRRPKRRVPGPAGLVDKFTDWDLKRNHNQKRNESQIAVIAQQHKMPQAPHDVNMNKIPLYSVSLWKGPWLNGCVENEIEVIEEKGVLYLTKSNLFFVDNLRSIQSRIDRVFPVKQIMVVLKTLHIEFDAIGEVIDPFDTMQATLTRKVLNKFTDIRCGSCFVLENVTVYQPTDHDFYLNITTNNISRHYSNNSAIPIHLKAKLKEFHKKLGIKASQQSILQKMEQTKTTKKGTAASPSSYFETKITKKRRYSEIADAPWLLPENPTKKRKKIQKIETKQKETDDEDEPIMAPKQRKVQNNDGEDSDDLVIMSEQRNADSDDDAIIKDMDMNETPHGNKRKQLILDEKQHETCADLENKDPQKDQMELSFDFNSTNEAKKVNESKPKSMSTSTDTQTTKNESSANSETIPKDFNCLKLMFSQFDDDGEDFSVDL